MVDEQSADIAMGVNMALEAKKVERIKKLELGIKA